MYCNKHEKKASFEREREAESRQFIHGINLEEVAEKRNARKELSKDARKLEIQEMRGVS
jgi:hypothetical protein